MIFDILALATSVSAYGLCSRTNHRFAANLPTVPIQGTATRSILVKGQMTPVTVSGTVRVVDGCSFALENVAITGPTSVQFFGGRSESDPASVRLTTDTVTIPMEQNTTYTFIQTAGNWVNYNDFTQINFFDPSTNAVIAQAVLPGSVADPSSTAAPVASSTAAATRTSTRPATTTTSSPTAVVTSGVEKVTFGLVSLLSLSLGLLL